MKKTISIILAVLIISCVCVSCSGSKTTFEAEIYYANMSKSNILSEKVNIKAANETEALKEAVQKMFVKPVGIDAVVVFPENTKLNFAKIEDNTAFLDFSNGIYSSDEVMSIIIRAAIVNTVTSIKGVNEVLITVNGTDYIDVKGDKVGLLQRTDIVLDAHGETTVNKYAKLYFADSNAEGLLSESRQITVTDKQTEEMQIVKALIKGPEGKSLVRTIPAETEILSVETKEGICFVNLSEQFITKHPGGTASETLTIYSIVNSLTELDYINQVQFLIEGQKRESFIHMIFNEPFSRNESYIK